MQWYCGLSTKAALLPHLDPIPYTKGRQPFEADGRMANREGGAVGGGFAGEEKFGELTIMYKTGREKSCLLVARVLQGCNLQT